MASKVNGLTLLAVSISLSVFGGCRIDEVSNGGGPGDNSGDCYGPGMDQSGPDGGAAVCLPFCDSLVGCGLLSPANLTECVQFCSAQWTANPTVTEQGCSCVEQQACEPQLSDYVCPGAPLPPNPAPDAGPWANCTVDETIAADGSCTEDIQCPGPNGWSYYSIDCTNPGSTGWTAIGGNTGGGATGGGTTTGGASTGGTTAGTSGGGSSGSVGGTVGTATAGSVSGGTTGTATSGTAGSTGGSTGSSGTCTRNQDCAYNQDCIGGTCLVRCSASCECPTGDACDADGYCQSQIPPPQACETDCDCNSGQKCVNDLCQ